LTICSILVLAQVWAEGSEVPALAPESAQVWAAESEVPAWALELAELV